MDKISRINESVSQLNTYCNEYYNKNDPSVTDKQYDDLLDELSILEQETGFILSDSPTQQVGYTVMDKLPKVTHSYPLLSLGKTTDINEFANFTKGKDADLMLKMDGLTGELIFENGTLVSGSTRGDGEEGSLITANIKTFKNVPLHIPYYDHLKITGEMYIHINDFNEINSNLPEEEKYKTPRNLASGSVQLLDSSECAKRNIYFCAFNVIEGMESINSLNQRLNNIRDLGFETVHRYTYTASDIKNIVEMIESLREYSIIHYLPIDGTVIMHDDIKYGNSLGRVGHHYKNGYAFKWEQESVETTLKDVEWSMGKTNALTPVGIFNTVQLDNTDVSRASLHNVSIVKGLQLGIGDKISVIKANQIIPQIVSNDTKSNNLIIPDTCPYCGSKTEIRKDNDSEVLVCTNVNCSGKRLGRFVNFVGKSGLNIDGLSEASLEKFIDKGWIKTFADIYHLDDHKAEIINMDGFGKKSYDKMWLAITNSREVKLSNFLVGLSVSNLGKTASKTISKYFDGDWQKFLLSFPHNFDWTSLDDFGDVIAKSLTDYFCDINNMEEWKSLLDEVTFIKPEQTFSTDNATVIINPFIGKSIVVTGSLNNFTRETIQAKIESLGAKAGNSVSKKTDYVLVGENAGSKFSKAKELNVKIITEKEFIEMIK